MKPFLIINPGSTSTKIAIYQDEKPLFSSSVNHSQKDLSAFTSVTAQKSMRESILLQCLETAGFQLSDLAGVIAIGGLLKKVDSGIYRVNDKMVADLLAATYGEHAANLGGLLARSIGDRFGLPSYVADPITVDEMQDIARISGHPLLPRYGRTHTLNHKRVAMTISEQLGKTYDKARLIIAHLGGGVSIGAHADGRIIDSTSSRGEGAFSMDRSGGLNGWELVKLCFSGTHTKNEVLELLNGKGGISAYLATRNFKEVEQQMKDGNPEAGDIFRAFCYQVSKEIASMSAVLSGQLDAIVLTGGIVYSAEAVKLIQDRISFLGPVFLSPGEQEMDSLAFYFNALEKNQIRLKEYES